MKCAVSTSPKAAAVAKAAGGGGGYHRQMDDSPPAFGNINSTASGRHLKHAYVRQLS